MLDDESQTPLVFMPQSYMEQFDQFENQEIAQLWQRIHELSKLAFFVHDFLTFLEFGDMVEVGFHYGE